MAKYKSALYKNKYRTQSLRLPFYDYSRPGYYFITICVKNKRKYFGKVKQYRVLLNRYGQIAQDNLEKLSAQFKHVKLDEYIIMPNHIHLIIQILKSIHGAPNHIMSSVEAIHGGREHIMSSVEGIHDGRERMMPQPVEAIHDAPNHIMSSVEAIHDGCERMMPQPVEAIHGGCERMMPQPVEAIHDAPNHIMSSVEAIHDGCERMMPQPVEAIHELPLRKKMIKNRRRMVLPMLIGKYKMMTSKAIHKLGLCDFAWQRNYYEHIIGDDDDLERIREYIKDNPKQWLASLNRK
ncbi:MAG: transposase [Candidatus Komeilibacteria bacterium]